MNRMAGKPKFMDDQSIALAAAEFARKDAEKKARKNLAEQQQNTNKQDEGKRKPYLKLTKGRLGTKVRKKDDDGAGIQVQQMERDIQGMESMHWCVVYHERDLEELKKSLDPQPPGTPLNIYDILYDAFELYTDQRKRNQIELIKEVIFELKRDYNKEFATL